MFIKTVSALTAFVFVVVLPILEVNDTHVFNPDWPAHARLHEVWQLITNAGLSLLALWLVFASGQVRIGAAVLLLISAGFVAAFLIQDIYGGSMTHPDGSQLLILGVNPAFGVLLVLSALLGSGLLLQTRSKGSR
jgi:hypothetical protein